MKPRFIYFLIISLGTLFSYSCKLTRTNVIGKWKTSQNDTLIINSDNSFLFIKNSNPIEIKQENYLSTSNTAIGQWTLNKKSIHFSFSDTSQNFGGNCYSFQYWTRLSKKKLIRPITCESPTHRFITITKIE